MSNIVRHVAELQQLHPFESVNGRTFILLLQYLLMAHGLPPATLEEPNAFFLTSQKQMTDLLSKGLEDTEKILAHDLTEPPLVLHGFQRKDNSDRHYQIVAESTNTNRTF